MLFLLCTLKISLYFYPITKGFYELTCVWCKSESFLIIISFKKK
ncbi:hypothetical protein LEP1GSC124_0038 [Leptospira interrogans serovar Pyrogenes str. 200701872]|uniref:Uncharacterized protein n=1 Tax=Leptospira interrogans serovar Pyrogenes str. 200701872 TaxID=1193029 RepID=M6ZY19_LEPIR|nr:hypothetical protein LEP1GSC124_0038 [Leptospira interrogans serovar Pyrogenes str. 200701872]